jgi:putative phage-type endonuclease
LKETQTKTLNLSGVFMKTQNESNTVPQEQQGESWLKWRKIGSSDSPAILGLSPYLTRLELFEQKLGLRPLPQENPGMTRGKEMEPVLRKLMQDKLGTILRPACVNCTQYEYLTASLDGVSWDGKIFCELKLNNEDFHQMAAKGDPVTFHGVQMQHQYVCSPEPDARCFYGSFCRNDFVVVEIPRNPITMREIVEEGFTFWNCLQKGEAPEPTEKDLIEFVDMETELLAQSLYESQQIRREEEAKIKARKKVEDDIESLLINKVGERNAKIGKYKFKKVIRRGSVQYDQIEALKALDLDQYRKAPSISWKLS